MSIVETFRRGGPPCPFTKNRRELVPPGRGLPPYSPKRPEVKGFPDSVSGESLVETRTTWSREVTPTMSPLYFTGSKHTHHSEVSSFGSATREGSTDTPRLSRTRSPVPGRGPSTWRDLDLVQRRRRDPEVKGLAVYPPILSDRWPTPPLPCPSESLPTGLIVSFYVP